MAWTFDQALFMKANASTETRTRFQRLIEHLLSRNLQAVQVEFDGMLDNEKVLVGLCVGKDGNTLTHRLCAGVVSENSIKFIEAMLPSDPVTILGAPNKKGMFPIHIAVENSLDNTVNYLVQQGVDINQRSLMEGNTAAVVAAINNDFDLLTTLVERGADITIKNKQGLTCQDYVLKNNDQETALKWSALMIIQSGVKSGMLIEKNDGKKRNTRAL